MFAALRGECAGGEAAAHAVAPEIVHAHEVVRQSFEQTRDRGGEDEVAQLARADDSDGARDAVDLRRETVEGAVGDLEQARGETGIAADDVADVRRGVAGAVDRLVHSLFVFGYRSEFVVAGHLFFWAEAHLDGSFSKPKKKKQKKAGGRH